MEIKKMTSKIAPEILKQKTPFLLWVLLVLALAVKILYLKSSMGGPFYDPLLLDPKYYHQWALRLVGGQWDTGVFYGLPLYPYFLALCYKVSDNSLLFVKSFQIALGMGTLFLIYKIGCKLRDVKVGLLAVFFAGIYGPLFFNETVLIAETLSLPLYALSFLCVLRFIDEINFKNAIFLGLAAGLATLTKAGILLFMTLFFIYLFFCTLGKKGKLSAVLVCLLFYFGILAPVTIHNFVRGQDHVFLTSHAGFNFYIGNNSQSQGVFVAPEGTGSNVEAQIADSRQVAEEEMGRPLKPSEISNFWAQKAWSFIRGNPRQFAELCGRKLALFFDSREISDVDDYQFGAKINEFLQIPWMNFAVLGPLVFMGFVSLMRQPGYRVVTFAWIGTYLVGLVSFFVTARYRLPLLPVFFPLAAMGVLDLWENLKKFSLINSLLLLAALAGGIVVSRMELVHTDWSRNYINAGDALLEKRDTLAAKDFYKQALEIDPYSGKANLAMGLVLTREGSYDEAKDYYVRAIDIDPENSQAFNNLGLWYDRKGEADSAEKYFLKAIELKPNSSQAHNNLGMVYGKRGDNEKALKEFELSLALNPNSARANTNLGLILRRAGQTEEARRLWERALEIDPEFNEAKKALELI